MRQLPVPFSIRADSGNFIAQLAAGDLGDIDVMSELSYTPHEFFRTRTEIGWSDPEAYRLLLGVQGTGGVTHGHGEVTIGPGDLLLCDTSRPMNGWRGLGNEPAEWRILTFPRRLLPLPGVLVSDLVGVRLPGGSRLACLVADLLRRAVGLDEIYRHQVAQRLGAAALDLLAALLALELDTTDIAPAESQRRTLILQMQDYITRQLADPELSPRAIAAAHHLSTRQLHRLFRQDEKTVAVWIRERRLEACRRDLADPLFAAQPVHAIAARWGLRDPAHFSRIFRAAYGFSPQTYRRRTEQCARGQAP
jgi:AraC-like DNA-binding protein